MSMPVNLWANANVCKKEEVNLIENLRAFHFVQTVHSVSNLLVALKRNKVQFQQLILSLWRFYIYIYHSPKTPTGIQRSRNNKRNLGTRSLAEHKQKGRDCRADAWPGSIIIIFIIRIVKMIIPILTYQYLPLYCSLLLLITVQCYYYHHKYYGDYDYYYNDVLGPYPSTFSSCNLKVWMEISFTSFHALYSIIFHYESITTPSLSPV